MSMAWITSLQDIEIMKETDMNLIYITSPQMQIIPFVATIKVNQTKYEKSNTLY